MSDEDGLEALMRDVGLDDFGDSTYDDFEDTKSKKNGKYGFADDFSTNNFGEGTFSGVYEEDIRGNDEIENIDDLLDSIDPSVQTYDEDDEPNMTYDNNKGKKSGFGNSTFGNTSFGESTFGDLDFDDSFGAKSINQNQSPPPEHAKNSIDELEFDFGDEDNAPSKRSSSSSSEEQQSPRQSFGYGIKNNSPPKNYDWEAPKQTFNNNYDIDDNSPPTSKKSWEDEERNPPSKIHKQSFSNFEQQRETNSNPPKKPDQDFKYKTKEKTPVGNVVQQDREAVRRDSRPQKDNMAKVFAFWGADANNVNPPTKKKPKSRSPSPKRAAPLPKVQQQVRPPSPVRRYEPEPEPPKPVKLSQPIHQPKVLERSEAPKPVITTPPASQEGTGATFSISYVKGDGMSSGSYDLRITSRGVIEKRTRDTSGQEVVSVVGNVNDNAVRDLKRAFTTSWDVILKVSTKRGRTTKTGEAIVFREGLTDRTNWFFEAGRPPAELNQLYNSVKQHLRSYL